MKLDRIKLDFLPTRQGEASALPVNDIAFRLILIPSFGIAIPLISGMVPHSLFTLWQIKLSYLFTIGIAMVIYEGNRLLLFTLRSYFDWFEKPMRKILALLLVIPFYTLPVSILLLVSWYFVFNQPVNWVMIKVNALAILVCVVFVVHVYETVFLVKEAESEKLARANEERIRAKAELEALKSQIDPHFMFNSLNTLSHFIESQPEKAKLFNDHLAEVYRYILQNKKRDLIPLDEELEFIRHYFSLLTIRYEGAIQMHLDLDEQPTEHFALPPISIQILVENAVKHNEFSDLHPLTVTLRLKQHALEVTNNFRPKKHPRKSTRTGLQNLKERYLITTGKHLHWAVQGDQFWVSMPVLKM
ncbi:MAG: histidine kinase [Saprospiraceae bacterium]|nr:histidine kinase [Saprospiraceae bacterium]